MRKFSIVTDTCSDMCEEMRKKYQVDYLKMRISYDGKDEPASLDWDIYTPKAYYDIMRGGKRVITAMVPMEEFKKYFTEKVEAGEDVLYIACSSALSGSVHVGSKVAEEILADHPEAKIYCIDALNASMGEGLMTIKASEMRAEGKSIDEVKEYIETERLSFHQFATVESLEYLKRAGRVKPAAAFFGNLFGIKPIIISDVKGNNVAVKKAKGRKNSFAEIIAGVKENIIDAENQTVFISNADCMEDALTVKKMIEDEVKPKDVYVCYIGPTVGASVGPGTIGVYFKGKMLTE